jgi:hypothetical protein
MLRHRLASLMVVAVFNSMTMTMMLLPGSAQAQKPPSRFCPTWKVISHNPRADRTGTPSDTFTQVKRVEGRHIGGFFHRCVGVVGVGLEIAKPRGEPTLIG